MAVAGGLPKAVVVEQGELSVDAEPGAHEMIGLGGGECGYHEVSGPALGRRHDCGVFGIASATP